MQYLPSLGRFAQVDPVEGGVDNNYVYPTDPVNSYDLTGEFVWFAPVVWFVARAVVTHVVKKVVTRAATRIAAQAWTKGKAGSRVANLTQHFNKHGAAMGYKTPFRYTIGAVKNRYKAPVAKMLKSGSRAYLGPAKRATFTYQGRISSYFKPTAKQWNRW